VAAQALRQIDFAPAVIADILARASAPKLHERLTQFRSGIIRASARGPAVQTLPFSESAAAAFAAAQQEAHSLRHNYLGTEHLLLGILSTSNKWSAFFASQRIPCETVREAVKAVLRQ
jgi:ATP-dependent Clp protease ATP-binding subunit ClpA